MFTYLGLRNFRAFEQVGIDLAPITILVGPNNAGKSSIISGLRLLAQTAASGDTRVPLLLKGPMGDFGTYRDLVYQNARRRTIGLTLGIQLTGRALPKDSREVRIDLNFAYRTQRREIVLRDSAMFDHTGRKIFSTSYSPHSEKHAAQLLVPKPNGDAVKVLKGHVRLTHFLLPIWQLMGPHAHKNIQEESSFELRRLAVLGEMAFQEFFFRLRSIEYLGPFRANPERTPLFSGERPTNLGMDGSRAIHLLAADYLRKGRYKRRLLNQIIQWLRAAEIAKDIKVRVLSDRHFEMLVQHPVTEEYENLADVGYGISQVLPVIAGGYNLEPGETLIVEQPEIHLHPRAQAELGEFFAKLYERNVQIIMETHSEHLVVRLQRYVASSRIKPKDILIYYVHAPAKVKELVKLPVGEDGLFLEKWPRGFFEDRLEEVTALARASQSGSR